MTPAIPPRIVRRTMNDAIIGVIVWSAFGAVFAGPIFSGGMLNLGLNFTSEQIALVLSFGQLFLPVQMLGAFIQQRWFDRKRFWIFWTLAYYTVFAVLTLMIWVWARIPAGVAVALFAIFYACAQFAGQMVGSVYVAWLGDIVPGRDSNTFWNRRQGWQLLAGVAAGVGLGWLVDALGRELRSTYAVVGAIGVLGGFLSLAVQLRIPKAETEENRKVLFKEQLQELTKNVRFRLLTAFFAFQAFVVMISCTFQFVYLTGNVADGMAGMTMTTVQILLALANLVGFACGYLFRVIGTKYGRKPVLMLCTGIKVIEFVLWGFIFAQPDQEQALLLAAPVFFLSGVDNMGLVSAQFSLLTCVTSQRVRGVAIGVFYAIVGGGGFCGTLLAGVWYPRVAAVDFAGYHFSAFNLLAFVSAIGFLLSLLILWRFREDGAAPTARVMRMLFSNSPIRSVYQPYLLSQPLTEASRVSTLMRADGNLSASEVAYDFYNPSSQVRQSAMLAVMREAGTLSPLLEDELIRLMDMPELGLQALAARALGVTGAMKAVPVLLRHVDGRDIALAQACVFAVGVIASPEAEGDLRRLLEQERYRLLWALAAEAISKIGGVEHVRLIYRAYLEEESDVLQVQYLLSLVRCVAVEKNLAHPAFEKEDRQSGSEIERLLKTLTSSNLFEEKEAKGVLEKMMNDYDAGRCAPVVAGLLVRLLRRFSLTPGAGESDELFLNRRFQAGGQLREAIFLQENRESVCLWLLMYLWNELQYRSESVNRFTLLSALLTAEALHSYAAWNGRAES